MKKYKDCPILVFDSGVGGISVLGELIRQMPSESFIYYGDSAHAPYGDHSEEVIRTFSDEIVSRFLPGGLGQQGIKCVVIACNTATAAAAAYLRKKYPELPIIGMEPALKPAAEKVDAARPKVLVLATDFTIHSEKLHILKERLEEKADYILLPAPGIVPFIENGDRDGQVSEGLKNYLEKLLHTYLSGEEKLDAIVLGCTHYPFIKETILEMFDYRIDIFDGAEGTARQTKKLLAEAGLLRGEVNKAQSEIGLYESESNPVQSASGDGPQIKLLNSDSSMLKLEKELLEFCLSEKKKAGKQSQ